MTIIRDLVAVKGTYTTRDGVEKKRFVNVGKEITKDDGGRFIVLDPSINLAALQRGNDGDVMVSIYEQKERDGATPQASQVSVDDYQRVSGGTSKPIQQAPFHDDSIPF
jgi:hypothetical protein